MKCAAAIANRQERRRCLSFGLREFQRPPPGQIQTGSASSAAPSRKICECLPRSRSRRLVRVDAAQSGPGLARFGTHANRFADFHRRLATGDRLAGRLAAWRLGSAWDGSVARPGLGQPVASRWWHVPALAADRARYEQQNRQTDAAADLFDGLHASSIGSARKKNLSRVQEKDSSACIGRVARGSAGDVVRTAVAGPSARSSTAR